MFVPSLTVNMWALTRMRARTGIIGYILHSVLLWFNPQLAIKLSELCALESSQLLLFQQSKAEILQVRCPLSLFIFLVYAF